jgi:hypothetical protein
MRRIGVNRGRERDVMMVRIWRQNPEETPRMSAEMVSRRYREWRIRPSGVCHVPVNGHLVQQWHAVEGGNDEVKSGGKTLDKSQDLWDVKKIESKKSIITEFDEHQGAPFVQLI